MCASGRPIELLLCCLLGSVQVFPPSRPPPVLPSPPNSETTREVDCPLTTSPSSLVVRFGDPFTANCSISSTDFSAIGWIVSLAVPEVSMDRFLVWRVDSMTDWSDEPKCFALSDQAGQCHIDLPLRVYKPPDNVSISFGDHTGPMLEGQRYTLRCAVQEVAPVENLTVTFYRGRTALGQLRSDNKSVKPVSETFSLNITPSKEDDGVQYWCEAKLELGPDGPQRPPVVTSQTITDTVLFGPQLECPLKLRVREGERLSCEVRGNPRPLVVWFRDGRAVALPTRSSAKDAGKYTVWAEGLLGQKNFTVEVEVLPGSGTTNGSNGHFLLAVLLVQMINWL
ncbi:intercellular adhesion molecule 1-like isoform X2 [Clinocottus analis]|uniref:intercellular adhesion molecule 1-like isoform X2 n=1 Tax=Clinocottus analis TaxID=304258 RepID=UPI0035BF2E81